MAGMTFGVKYRAGEEVKNVNGEPLESNLEEFLTIRNSSLHYLHFDRIVGCSRSINKTEQIKNPFEQRLYIPTR